MSDSNGTAVARREAGLLDTATDEGWNLVARKAASIAKSTVIPEDYRGKPENVLIAMDMAQRLGLPALTVMQNLHIIKGKPSWSAQFLIAAVNGSGRFSPLRYEFEGKPGTDSWGCRAYAHDLDTGEKLTGTLITMEMARVEGWSTKRDSKWLTMPEQMLRYRAAAFWARVYSPELTGGLHTELEVMDVGPTHQTRVQSLAAALDEPEGEVQVATVVEDEDPEQLEAERAALDAEEAGVGI